MTTPAASTALGGTTPSAAFIALADSLRAAKNGPPPTSLEQARAGADRAARLPTIPDGIIFEPGVIDGIHCEWSLPPPHRTSDTLAKEEAVVVYAHGGGFVVGSLASHRNICAHITLHTGLPTLAVAYRLSPEHPYPAATTDLFSVCESLDRTGHPIVLAGDSAGANIALRCAIARSRHHLATRAIVLFSPMIDLTFSGATIETNRDTDAMLNLASLKHGAAAYRGDVPADSPDVSPLLGPLDGLPPLIVHASTTEMLLDDATRLVQRVNANGGNATLLTTVDAPHVVIQGAGNVPEADEVLAAVAALLTPHLAPERKPQ